MVTWSTRGPSNSSLVIYARSYAKDPLTVVKGTWKRFVDGGKKARTQYVHSVELKDLQPDTRYEYTCGSDVGWSPVFNFKTPPAGQDWSPSLAIFGDMGNENAQSLGRLQQDTERGMYDAIIHVGDFAYDMDSSNAAVGDAYMRQIESVAAYVPYMVCPGNHEEK